MSQKPVSDQASKRSKMAKTSIKRSDKREGIKPGAHSNNPNRKVADQAKGRFLY